MLASISSEDVADRLAIRQLIDAYAFCADTRDAEGQKALFTADTRFVVYMEGEGSDPTDDLHGRESLTPVFENLNTYEMTMHLNGQSTVTIDADRATGYTYCVAHHVYSESGHAEADGRVPSLSRHRRQGTGHLAVRRAPALPRLGRNAHPVSVC